MLAEYLDGSDKALPEPGYRPREFARFEESNDYCIEDESSSVDSGALDVGEGRGTSTKI